MMEVMGIRQSESGRDNIDIHKAHDTRYASLQKLK